jgi:hypothetical protein
MTSASLQEPSSAVCTLRSQEHFAKLNPELDRQGAGTGLEKIKLFPCRRREGKVS